MNPLIDDGPVRLLREGAVAILELNRPQAHNALDVAAARAFAQATERLVREDGVRAVLLWGNGRSFGVGGDLQSLAGGGAGDTAAPGAAAAREIIESLHGAVRRLASLDAPWIAAVHGAVAGGSLSLALAADLAIAADDARLNLAYARIGASCDVNGSYALPRLLGLRRAMAFALLSPTVDADEALSLGLVNRVVPRERLREEALALAQQLADGPTLAFGRLKRLLRASLDRDLDTQLDAEREAFLSGCATEDFREGTRAFLEKREPRFRGR